MKKETKIALTAIAALILLFIGLNFLKGVNVFQSTNTYYVKLKNSAGIAVSNAVYANGYPVGIVRTIDYDYKRGESVVVGIELDEQMRVPKGTVAELEVELMGGVKMVLLLGPNPVSCIEQLDTIPGRMHEGAMDKVQAMIPAVEGMVPKLDSIMDSLNKLLSDPALAGTLRNTEALTADLARTTKSLDRVMQGDLPQTLSHLKQTSINAERLTGNLAALDLNATMKTVDETVKNVNGVVEDLNGKLKGNDNTLGLFLNDRGVYDNLNATLRNADSLMIDLKAHPKRYVHFSVFGKKDK